MGKKEGMGRKEGMDLKLVITRKIFQLACAGMPLLILTACSADVNREQPENYRLTVEPDGTENNGQADPPAAAAPGKTENSEQSAIGALPSSQESEGNETGKMKVQAGDSTFTAVLEENPAAEAFAELMENTPVVIRMSDYSGFEKTGGLGTELPADDRQTTTAAGDIVLYNGNQIVIFYGSHSWSYTRLGKIDDLTGWEEALGSGNVTVTFSLD